MRRWICVWDFRGGAQSVGEGHMRSSFLRDECYEHMAGYNWEQKVFYWTHSSFRIDLIFFSHSLIS